MKSNDEQLKSRGYVDEHEIKDFLDVSKEELLDFLHSKEAAKRTIAARLLKNNRDMNILKELISCLLKEKKLYTKIELSESVSAYGEEASQILIQHLGKVGKNQHAELPDKPFEKSSYPLPRDIISRTICKIGVPAIQYLRDCLHTGLYKQKLEAIDAIGFISYYENDHSCQNDLIVMIDQYKDDPLMIWKILRALQSFNSVEVLEILEKFVNSDIKQLRWEARRSITGFQRKKFNNTK